MRKKGLTIIEVVVVVSIAAILIVVALVNFRSSAKKEKEVESSAREVTGVIREAQNYALTGKQPDPNKVPCSYYFRKVNDSQYEILYTYHVVGDTGCTKPPEVYATYSLKNKVIIGDFTNFYFKVPFGDIVDDAGVPITSNVKIKISKDAVIYCVLVYPSGSVSASADISLCTP
jgi:prepilin-type N-terminal cleavage/methylation domain-containing protein